VKPISNSKAYPESDEQRLQMASAASAPVSAAATAAADKVYTEPEVHAFLAFLALFSYEADNIGYTSSSLLLQAAEYLRKTIPLLTTAQAPDTPRHLRKVTIPSVKLLL
jgi:hypothetical protein